MNLANKIAMENRAHQRENLAYEQVPGNFLIEVGAQKHVFSQVNDVSISGLGILIDKHIPEGSAVWVSYHSVDFSISIAANVVWSNQLADGVYRMGVQFDSGKMDDNVLLFMTLRKYIDEFGSPL